jgi:hypothetical protein
MVRSWFRARSEMVLEEYRGYYSPEFQPGGFEDREAWAAAQRVDTEWPRLRLSDLQVTLVHADMARAVFVEVHRSDDAWPVLRTTLLLRLEQNDWKILEERSVPLSEASGLPSLPSEE